MHIPQSILHGNICPVTLTVSLVGIGTAAVACYRSKDQVSAQQWAGVSALIFGIQMLNYPVTNGISGHLIGGILAVSLIGIPKAVLSMAMVLVIQAFLFADGGIGALGANILNMALIGTGAGGFLFKYLSESQAPRNYSLAIASFLSVVLAAIACAFEIASSGAVTFGTMARSMLPAHVLIATGEAILTVLLCLVLNPVSNVARVNRLIKRTALCGLAALAMAPFASSFPDGLEMALCQLNLAVTYSSPVSAWFRDYQISAINNSYVSAAGAGFLGAAVVWISTMGMAKKLRIRVQA